MVFPCNYAQVRETCLSATIRARVPKDLVQFACASVTGGKLRGRR